jgi:glycosyltransferase involved in cell wall biosynthesis
MLGLSYSMADQHFERGKSVGIFNVSRGLAARLARHLEIHNFTIFVNDSLLGALDLPPHARIQTCNSAARSRIGRVLWDQLGVYREARRSKNEWLLLAKGFASFVAPCPVQLAAIVYDTMLDYYEQVYPAFVSRLERWYFRQSLVATFRQARVIFTISNFAARELARVARDFQVSCPPIVTMGVGFSPVGVEWTLKEDRILLLVSPTPHKRTDTAIDYLQRWQRESGFQGTIDCVGRLPPGHEIPLDANWRFHGRLPDADYQRLLRTSRVVVFFSEYEGFGMPPVEAILAKACPVYSDITVTREVMDGIGCPFTNDEFASFRNAMNEALNVSNGRIDDWSTQLLPRHDWAAVEARVVNGLRTFGS